MLIHGLRGRASDLDGLATVLEEAGHAVIAPDLPGHGSRSDDEFTIGESLHVIADSAAGMSTRPLIVGFALGGHLAVQFAAITASAAGVVAVGCGTQALDWFLDSYRIASAAYGAVPDKGAALSSLAATTFVGAVPKHNRGSIPGQFFDTLGQLHALDTPAALARLEVPVWLLNGQYDRFRMQERAFVKSAKTASLVRQRGVRLAGGITKPNETGRLLAEIASQLP
jgi:pimeloyl-ACP methyl ester carboxylesterase